MSPSPVPVDSKRAQRGTKRQANGDAKPSSTKTKCTLAPPNSIGDSRENSPTPKRQKREQKSVTTEAPKTTRPGDIIESEGHRANAPAPAPVKPQVNIKPPTSPCHPRLPAKNPQAWWNWNAQRYTELESHGELKLGCLLYYPVHKVEDLADNVLRIQYFGDPKRYLVPRRALSCMVTQDLDGRIRQRLFAQKVWLEEREGVLESISRVLTKGKQTNHRSLALSVVAGVVGLTGFVLAGWPGGS
ncbi:hypothetical protein BU16DRAFT_341875 [Lophium mytilinum]|uniref:Uncharacterized protein n=1 Tax=Lophium mytilinum TaxID=390894 RepID=A0A6A6QXJ1_9PEZI|nr:hypothetical protein BU16DRAFT_341875 [Lophium mytilinum]